MVVERKWQKLQKILKISEKKNKERKQDVCSRPRIKNNYKRDLATIKSDGGKNLPKNQ